MKRRFTRREWTLLLAPLFILILPYAAGVDWLGLPFKYRRNETLGHACRVNMKNVAIALRQYSQDYDDRFPATGTAPMKATSMGSTQFPVGWVDALVPYSGGGIPTLTICPASNTIGVRSFSPSVRNYTTFWLNANLSGVAYKDVRFPVRTLCLGDGNDGKDLTDATYSKSAIPPAWLSDTSSPAYRHLGGANYLMVDGSVHWLKPNEVTTFGGRKNAFVIK